MLVDVAEDLAQKCNDAYRDGANFPTIWNTLIKDDLRIRGRLEQTRIREEPALQVLLFTGQRLVFFGSVGFSVR